MQKYKSHTPVVGEQPPDMATRRSSGDRKVSFNEEEKQTLQSYRSQRDMRLDMEKIEDAKRKGGRPRDASPAFDMKMREANRKFDMARVKINA